MYMNTHIAMLECEYACELHEHTYATLNFDHADRDRERERERETAFMHLFAHSAIRIYIVAFYPTYVCASADFSSMPCRTTTPGVACSLWANLGLGFNLSLGP